MCRRSHEVRRLALNNTSTPAISIIVRLSTIIIAEHQATDRWDVDRLCVPELTQNRFPLEYLIEAIDQIVPVLLIDIWIEAPQMVTQGASVK